MTRLAGTATSRAFERTLAYVPMDAFHRGLVTAAVAALEAGVELIGEDLADPATQAELDTSVQSVAEMRVSEAEQNTGRAFAAVGLARDDAERAELTEAAEAARRQLLEARADLQAALNAAPQGARRPVSVIVDDLLRSLQLLLAENVRVGPLEAAALETVLPNLAISRAHDGTWTASCCIRLPTTSGGVVRLGPLTWSVKTRNVRGSTPLR